MPKVKGKYETMFITDLSLGEEGVSALIEKIEEVITSNGGEITNKADWGKRRLAYPINDLNEGYYTLIDFESSPDFPSELDRIYKISEGIMRSMIIAKE